MEEACRTVKAFKVPLALSLFASEDENRNHRKQISTQSQSVDLHAVAKKGQLQCVAMSSSP